MYFFSSVLMGEVGVNGGGVVSFGAFVGGVVGVGGVKSSISSGSTIGSVALASRSGLRRTLTGCGGSRVPINAAFTNLLELVMDRVMGALSLNGLRANFCCLSWAYG